MPSRKKKGKVFLGKIIERKQSSKQKNVASLLETTFELIFCFDTPLRPGANYCTAIATTNGRFSNR